MRGFNSGKVPLRAPFRPWEGTFLPGGGELRPSLDRRCSCLAGLLGSPPQPHISQKETVLTVPQDGDFSRNGPRRAGSVEITCASRNVENRTGEQLYANLGGS